LPELPEVETVVRSIRPLVRGCRIQSALFQSRFVTQGDFGAIAQALIGKRIQEVRRVGKHIFLELDDGILHIHLGMTGKLLWNGAPTPYTRAVIALEGGALVYDDVRQFGRVNYYTEPPARFSELGPDALDSTFAGFASELKRRNTAIKALLLNQRVVSGIGNIYADEILFASGVHPKARCNRISKPRAQRIFTEMKRILEAAIEHRGSSISDYVDAENRQGGYQLLHRVYGKQDEPCPECGAVIRRIVVGQRGTHYCPRCQRA
jgi:formamidopyrimidine-DNA glycosylase